MVINLKRKISCLKRGYKPKNGNKLFKHGYKPTNDNKLFETWL